MLEKNNLNFDDLISVISAKVRKDEISVEQAKSPIYKMLSNISFDNNSNNMREKSLKNMRKICEEQDYGFKNETKGSFYLYSLVLLSFFVFSIILTSLSAIFIWLFGSPNTMVVDIIASMIMCLISLTLTTPIMGKVNKKMYSWLYDKSNKEIMNALQEEININFKESNNKIYVAEYLYYLNKFEGGLKNQKNLLLLTYLIDKYGVEEKNVGDCLLSEIKGIPVLRDIKNGVRKVKIMWFKYKMSKKVDWDNVYKEVSMFTEEYK